MHRFIYEKKGNDQYKLDMQLTFKPGMTWRFVHEHPLTLSSLYSSSSNSCAFIHIKDLVGTSSSISSLFLTYCNSTKTYNKTNWYIKWITIINVMSIILYIIFSISYMSDTCCYNAFTYNLYPNNTCLHYIYHLITIQEQGKCSKSVNKYFTLYMIKSGS